MRAKLLAAYACALQTPELFADKEAVEAVHKKLSNLALPVVTEQKALTALGSEAE